MEDWGSNFLTSDFTAVFKLIKPLSAYGKQHHNNFEVFTRENKQELEDFLKKIEITQKFLKTNAKTSIKLKRLLKQINNIDKYIDQIRSCAVTDICLFEINRCCNLLSEIFQQVIGSKVAQFIGAGQYVLDAVLHILQAGNIVDGGFYIANSYSAKLGELRSQLRDCERQLVMQQQESTQRVYEVMGTKIKDVFTVSKSEKDLINKLFLLHEIELVYENEYAVKFKVRENKKTVSLKNIKSNIEKQLFIELLQVRDKIGQSLSPFLSELEQLLSAIGRLDVLIARAQVANDLQCVKPILVEENIIDIQNGRHPILEKKLQSKGSDFTPRSITLPAGVSLITGINMGGKTVTLRLIQLLTTMVHAGMPVPAERMVVGLRDFIHFSRSDEDSILTGLSHFGQEINSINTVLAKMSKRGLVLIDEIAHGTTPLAGESLAIAVLEKLHQGNCIVVVTTHYSGISEMVPVYEWQTKGLNYVRWQHAQLEEGQFSIENLSACVDYRLEPVNAVKSKNSEALNIAKLLGMEQEIVIRARQILQQRNKE